MRMTLLVRRIYAMRTRAN